MNNTILKGSLLIAAAACCYGMLGTFVKMAYLAGFSTAEVTVSQFVLGFLGLWIVHRTGSRTTGKHADHKTERKNAIKMAVAGTSLGLTSIFYYMAIKYIPVSIGIVLLLQAVWMSMVLESLLKKKRPELFRIVAVCIILSGTVLATGVLRENNQGNWQGICWGLLAALSYTATMYSSNHVALQLPPLRRSFLMITGGLVIVLLVFLPSMLHGFSLHIFLSWGLPISLFGTVLPPILFTKGMPLTGMGPGAILTSLEVPVSIIFAHYILGESTSPLQRVGVILILAAVVLINRQQHIV